VVKDTRAECSEHCVHRKARALLHSDEAVLHRLDELHFDKSPFLTELGRYEEAADILMQNGKGIDAIKLYLRADSESSRAKACEALPEEWWRILPLRATTAASSSTIKELCRLSDQLKSPKLSWNEEVCRFGCNDRC